MTCLCRGEECHVREKNAMAGILQSWRAQGMVVEVAHNNVHCQQRQSLPRRHGRRKEECHAYGLQCPTPGNRQDRYGGRRGKEEIFTARRTYPMPSETNKTPKLPSKFPCPCVPAQRFPVPKKVCNAKCKTHKYQQQSPESGRMSFLHGERRGRREYKESEEGPTCPRRKRPV